MMKEFLGIDQFTNPLMSITLWMTWMTFIGFTFRGRDYGMAATSFGPSNTLFKFQLINSKHKLLKFEIVMNNFP
jgi:hypothetical protein